MPAEHFICLGLAPTERDPRVVAGRFAVERARCLAELHDPRRHIAARERLDRLHLAYRAVLRELATPSAPVAKAAPSGALPHSADDLRALIADSLEDGLLRYTRRQMILERARALGYSEFHAQLLIAQVQFGNVGDASVPLPSPATHLRRASTERIWARFAAVTILALAMLLGMIRWVGV
jgi:hypothetical protein